MIRMKATNCLITNISLALYVYIYIIRYISWKDTAYEPASEFWQALGFQPFTPVEHHQSQGHLWRLIERSLSAKNGKDLHGDGMETSLTSLRDMKNKEVALGLAISWFTEKKERLSGV